MNPSKGLFRCQILAFWIICAATTHGQIKNPPFLAVLFLTGCTGLIFSGTIQAQEQQSWDLRGRLDASWRYRSQNRTGQIDQTALLYGYLLDSPTGTSTDKEITYFENDITSHVFDVQMWG
jgi:hypothetical protein